MKQQQDQQQQKEQQQPQPPKKAQTVSAKEWLPITDKIHKQEHPVGMAMSLMDCDLGLQLPLFYHDLPCLPVIYSVEHGKW